MIWVQMPFFMMGAIPDPQFYHSIVREICQVKIPAVGKLRG
jgi:hypothetical protein